MTTLTNFSECLRSIIKLQSEREATEEDDNYKLNLNMGLMPIKPVYMYGNGIFDLWNLDELNRKYTTKEEAKILYDENFNERMRRYEEDLSAYNRMKSRHLQRYLTDEMILKYYELYKDDPHMFIDLVLENYHHDHMPFTVTFTVDEPFVRTLSSNEKVVSCIMDLIRWSNQVNNGRVDLLKKHELNIEELNEVTKIIVNPPYPLRNCHIDDEYSTDPTQQFDMISNENLRFMKEIMANNLRMRNIDQESTTIMFSYPDVESEYIDNFYLEHFDKSMMKVYPALSKNKIVKNCTPIVREAFIEALYTGTFNPNMSDKDSQELLELFTRFELKSYAMLAFLINYINNGVKYDYSKFFDETDISILKS